MNPPTAARSADFAHWEPRIEDDALLRGQFVDSLLLAEQRAVGGGL